MGNKAFPTTTQNFPLIINTNAVYVDKTQFAVPLVKNEAQSNFFLSRPRRFGKSLFLSVLEQVFLGNKDLFKDLYIYDKIEWETYPIIQLSLDNIGYPSIGLAEALLITTQKIAEKEGITLNCTSASLCFGEVIHKLATKYKKGVVVLIDEYDKPIVNYVEKGDTAQAEKNRDILNDFYGILKDTGEYHQ